MQKNQNVFLFYVRVLLYCLVALLIRAAALAPLAALFVFPADSLWRWLWVVSPLMVVFLVLPLRFSFADALVQRPRTRDFSIDRALSLRQYGEKLAESLRHALSVLKWAIPLAGLGAWGYYLKEQYTVKGLLDGLRELGKNVSGTWYAVVNFFRGLFGHLPLETVEGSYMQGVYTVLALVGLGLLILLTGWKAPVRYGLAALCCSLGGAVKPSAYILLIAALLLGTIRFLFHKKDAALWKRGLCVLAAVIIGVLPGMALEKGSVKLLTGSTAPEEALGSAHYLMIGLDDQYWGGHSAEGVTYSGSFATAKERTRANLARALEEVQNRTMGENLHFFSVKAYKAYADGTFAFNSYLVEEPVRRSDRLSLFLRKIFYREGAWNPAYRAVMQGLWLMVLLGCLAAALLRRREYAVQLCALSLLGLTAYQLLFEVWPRYLFLYAPVFLVLALLGVEKLGQRREKQ